MAAEPEAKPKPKHTFKIIDLTGDTIPFQAVKEDEQKEEEPAPRTALVEMPEEPDRPQPDRKQERAEERARKRSAQRLKKLGVRVFAGPHQSGTVSFVPNGDCEETAHWLAKQGIAVRAGLHCAPLAHESAETLESGTVRVSFGHDATPGQVGALLQAMENFQNSGAGVM